jgi:ATP-dependent helicase/nuclease subunit A
MTTADARPAALPDAEARRAIREELGVSLLVEAAAGTGKTTSLIDRMTALVRRGAAAIDHLSAVTFTIRAAAELSERFQASLEAAARGASGDEKARLETALSRLDSAFIGTIHAFCARLIRERPVEAGVDPGFSEMDEPEDAAERREAWSRYSEKLFTRDSEILPRLASLGVRLEDLRQTYETISENEDVVPAIGEEEAPPDFGAERAAVEGFLGGALPGIPAETPPGGWTEFQEAVRRAARLLSLHDASDTPAFVQALEALGRARKKSTQAGRLRTEFETLCRESVEPALERWRRHLHPVLMRAVAPAADEYTAWRRRNGRLNFQDLLLLARDLLRDHPHVRRAFQERFVPILVDEFQDTDPIQAEILFYLTGEDTGERDWKKLSPRPGSLFVVGDPKQSIYRFRRADIETYGIVRERLEKCGRVVKLTANFRATGRLCAWVNQAFAGQFPDDATPAQAAWVPLEAQRPEGGPGVFRLEIRTPGASTAPVVGQDATRIARAIEAAVRRGDRRPGDFLVLFRTRRYMSEYARELEARRIPYELSGGGAFENSDELRALLPLLRAVADPDDPVAFAAVLRGPLFGVDDAALYGHARAGGRFSFRAALPADPDPRIESACRILREAEELAGELPPGAAIARLCGRLGWTAYAAARELGDSRAGNLLKAIAAARTFSTEGLDFGGVVAELDRLTSEGYIEEMSMRPGRPGAVRLMTVHGAKGLEAPVVFLADPRRDPSRPIRFWIDRSGEKPEGHWRILRETDGFGVVDIAAPRGWEEMEQVEKAFDDAERVRLLYVAATRAREALVVSVWKQGRSENAKGSWAALAPFLPEDLPEDSAPPRAAEPVPLAGLASALDAFRAQRLRRAASGAAPTHRVAAVTDLAHAGPKPAWESTGRGMSWGRVLHGALEAAMRDPKLDLRMHVANLLAAEERPGGEIEEALRIVEGVRGSPLWSRALSARQCLVEVPFALKVESPELGFGPGPSETVLQGAIDLAFEEEDGWVLVDYKSDAVSSNRDDLVRFYSPQVALYRRYWERLTGRTARAGLFFLSTGELVWVEPA